jgi:peroxin-4
MEKRILREFATHSKQNNPNIKLIITNSLNELEAEITGLENTPFFKGLFKLKIRIPNDYPLKPPNIQFITRICHPNVDFDTGEICLDLLKEEWSPSWTIVSTCEAIRMLMGEPQPLSPLNVDCAKLLRIGDLLGYESLCRMYTREYAI